MEGLSNTLAWWKASSQTEKALFTYTLKEAARRVPKGSQVGSRNAGRSYQDKTPVWSFSPSGRKADKDLKLKSVLKGQQMVGKKKEQYHVTGAEKGVEE